MLLVAALLVSCNGATGNQPEEKTATKEMNGTAAEKTADDKETSVKLVHLDKESFKLKVMNYEKNPQEWVFEGDKPCIIDFYADWCKPCRMIAPILEELAVEYEGQIDVYKVDTQKERELASVFGIQSLPTVLFVPAKGNPSAQKGALPKESYKQIIDEFLLNKKPTQ